MRLKIGNIACEQGLLFGMVTRTSEQWAGGDGEYHKGRSGLPEETRQLD
jgi:hypothetical protein